MLEMNQHIIILLGLMLTITSCSSNIQIVKYIDLNSPLTLTIYTTNDQTGLTQIDKEIIEPKSEKFYKLIDWSKANSDHWRSTFASYIGNVSVIQKDFRLLYLQDGVVIGFTDDHGKSKQYRRSITKGDLDFLIIREVE